MKSLYNPNRSSIQMPHSISSKYFQTIEIPWKFNFQLKSIKICEELCNHKKTIFFPVLNSKTKIPWYISEWFAHTHITFYFFRGFAFPLNICNPLHFLLQIAASPSSDLQKECWEDTQFSETAIFKIILKFNFQIF